MSGATLRIQITFVQTAAGLRGTIDIPQQGATGLQLAALEVTGQKIRFELRAGTTAVFDGELADGVISGAFTQGVATGTFSLAPPRPVEVPPVPARGEELTVLNGAVTLAGTLSLPAGRPPFPTVVLITGSGPQNRDEEVAGFKVFATIAADLVNRGIAVYRYDDRGVGGSTGSIGSSTDDDFAADVLAIVAKLRTRPEIDSKRLGLLGHSEGASVAALAASRFRDVAFLVLLAPPGMRGDEILRQQAADGARAMGADGDAVTRIVTAHRKLTEGALAGRTSDELAPLVKELIAAQYDALSPAQQAAIGNRAAFIEISYRSVAIQVASPWMRFMLGFDPTTPLRQVACPVLALFGTLDTQVPVSQNEPRVRSALSANTMRGFELCREPIICFRPRGPAS